MRDQDKDNLMPEIIEPERNLQRREGGRREIVVHDDRTNAMIHSQGNLTALGMRWLESNHQETVFHAEAKAEFREGFFKRRIVKASIKIRRY